jgi:hypothetical protein
VSGSECIDFNIQEYDNPCPEKPRRSQDLFTHSCRNINRPARIFYEN